MGGAANIKQTGQKWLQGRQEMRLVRGDRQQKALFKVQKITHDGRETEKNQINMGLRHPLIFIKLFRHTLTERDVEIFFPS